MPDVGNPMMHAKMPAGRGYTPFSTRLTGGLQDITRMVEDNAKTMDAIQEIGIELTRTIASFTANVSKYAAMLDGVLDTVFPIILSLPILDANTRKMLTDLKDAAEKILSSAGTVAKLAADIETGLVQGDLKQLQGHATSLQNVTATLKTLLPK